MTVPPHENPSFGWRRLLRILAALGLLAIAAAFLVFGMPKEEIGKRDYAQYWAAGKLLVGGHDPYDPASILKLEQEAGSTRVEAQVSFSPPFALLLALPLGFLSAKSGAILWMLAIILSLVASVHILKDLYRTENERDHLLGYLFAPVLACVMVGQLDIFLLLALVLFLKLHLEKPFLAGAALFPFAMKPHLLLPFALVLLAWSVSRKEFRVLLGAICALVAETLLIQAIDHHAWSQYFQMVHTVQPTHYFIPTWSVLLRMAINPQAAWVQFVPEACCCLWALWYFWTRRNQWSWTEQGIVILLVSLVCAAYAWFYDDVIVLPAIFLTVQRSEKTGRSLLPLGVLTLAALLEVMWRVDLASVFYLWTAPAWLAWYLFATRGEAASVEKPLSDLSVG